MAKRYARPVSEYDAEFQDDSTQPVTPITLPPAPQPSASRYPLVFTRGKRRLSFVHGEDPKAAYLLGSGWTQEK